MLQRPVIPKLDYSGRILAGPIVFSQKRPRRAAQVNKEGGKKIKRWIWNVHGVQKPFPVLKIRGMSIFITW